MSEPIADNDFVDSPGEIDARDAAEFLEDSEALIATNMDPVLDNGSLNFVTHSCAGPIAEADAGGNMDWPDIPAYTAYSSPHNHYHIHDLYSGGIGVTAPRYLWQNLPAFDWEGTGIETFMLPPSPKDGSNQPWQLNAAQYSMWLFDPSNQLVGGDYYWAQAMYAHRARFRCNQAVRVWVATADLYATDPPLNTNGPWAYLELSNVVQTQTQTRLAANTWKELAIPSVSTPNLTNGFVGRVRFAIYGETVEGWEARTSISVA